MAAFRDEICLTADLRHPNIVNFIGCCFGKDLMALVLEWVERGTLGDVLAQQSELDLTWNDPLLKLVMDVARGGEYLHSRSIVHRDLKPENCLCTEFLTCKISDFGTSRYWRSAAGDEASMTATGTPMFVAPEVSRGEEYGEKVDVYSFGVLLLCVAVEQSITEFIGQRWCAHFDKSRIPNTNTIAFNRVLAPIWEGRWKPVSEAAPVPQAPPAVSALISRCTSFSPELRPSFSEVLAALTGPVMSEVIGSPVAFTRVAPPSPTQLPAAVPKVEGQPKMGARQNQPTTSPQQQRVMWSDRPEVGRGALRADNKQLSMVEEGEEGEEAGSFVFANPIKTAELLRERESKGEYRDGESYA